jgi:hypothetical protein
VDVRPRRPACNTLAEERLARCVGRFLSTVPSQQIVLRNTKWRKSE